MKKESIEKIADLAVAANVIEVDGKKYWGDNKKLVMDVQRPNTLQVESLSSIVDYIAAPREGYEADALIIHVENQKSVKLYEKITGEDKKRTVLIHAECDDSQDFPFGRWLSKDEFTIKVISLFQKTDDKSLLLNIAKTLKYSEDLENEETGISTSATARKGLSSSAVDKIPSVFNLRPFRTFRQIEDQPESSFIFRIEYDDDIKCQLVEADGGAWKHSASKSIKDYLAAAIKGVQFIS